MAGSKSFLFYFDWRQHLQLLTDAEQRQLIFALLDYAETGALPENITGATGMAFSFMRAQLDRDMEKYKKRCEQNRENGLKGGRPPKQMDGGDTSTTTH